MTQNCPIFFYQAWIRINTDPDPQPWLRSRLDYSISVADPEPDIWSFLLQPVKKAPAPALTTDPDFAFSEKKR